MTPGCICNLGTFVSLPIVLCVVLGGYLQITARYVYLLVLTCFAFVTEGKERNQSQAASEEPSVKVTAMD